MKAVYSSVAFTAAGVPAAAATVEVRREDNGALASIWSDEAGTTPLTNPSAFADANGRFAFYANGLERGYSVKVTKDAFNYTLHNQAVGTAAQFDATAYAASLFAAASASAARAILGLSSGWVQKLFTDSTDRANVGAGETTLSTYTLLAGTLAPNRGIRIRAWGRSANNANVKTLKIWFGSQNFAFNLPINELNQWAIDEDILYKGPQLQTNAVEVFSQAAAGIAVAGGTFNTTAQNELGDIIIKATGQGVASADVTQYGFTIELLN